MAEDHLHWDLDETGRRRKLPRPVSPEEISQRIARLSKRITSITPGDRSRGSALEAYHQQQVVRFPGRFVYLPILGLLLVSFFFVVDITYPWPSYVTLTTRDWLVLRGTWNLLYVVLLATVAIRPENETLQKVRDYTLVIGTSFALGIACAHTGRLGSPYYIGIFLLAIARCTVLPGDFAHVLRLFVTVIVTFVPAALLWPSTLAPGAGGAASVLVSVSIASGMFLLLIGTYLADRLALGLEAAKIMGRYRLVRKLGSGGMGEVFLANHASLKRPCAVKILKQELCTPDSVARFEREAEAASRLRHPNTIAVFDFGRTEEGQPYYVMEYLEGCDLRALVAEEGPLLPARAQYLLLQAARSLAEAHVLSMVHRDVQPGNLFVTSTAGHGDFLKVLDFGLVKGADLGPELTRGDAFMGTPRYMSPEALTGKRVDARADVYSLGAVGYFLLCGEPPFVSDDTYADMYRSIHDALPPLLERRGDRLPEPSLELIKVIERCLEKDAGKRFAHAGEVVRALERTPEEGGWRAASVRAQVLVGDGKPTEGTLHVAQRGSK